jgi:hypothetical protein
MVQTLCILYRFDVGFYSKENNLKLSYSIHIKEEIVGAYGSCGEEQIRAEAFDRET